MRIGTCNLMLCPIYLSALSLFRYRFRVRGPGMYGECDIIFDPVPSHFSAPGHPTRAV